MFTGINGIVEGTPVSVRGAGSRRLVINVPEGTEVVVANKELPKKNPLWDKALEVEDVKPGMFFWNYRLTNGQPDKLDGDLFKVLSRPFRRKQYYPDSTTGREDLMITVLLTEDPFSSYVRKIITDVPLANMGITPYVDDQGVPLRWNEGIFSMSLK